MKFIYAILFQNFDKVNNEYNAILVSPLPSPLKKHLDIKQYESL